MYIGKHKYQWYAVYTRVNQEKKIASLLNEQKIEFYLPLIKKLRQWSDRKKWIKEPLFKCYIFVRVSYREFYRVIDMPGVVGYVSFGCKPQSIPDNQIENIKTIVNESEKEIIITRDKISKGITVEVNFGPLKGVHGEIVKICGQSRILIRITAMGCCIHTNISKDQVKILPPDRNRTKIKHQSVYKNRLSTSV
ncbi:UpxY family transcription antiterminator [uncultured Draconibacterium sp.]|uniref:UpxY family transcription antiterminator n=1 Tax=uncultured Draconibacterium sp. TaxID=1573823 RepID=UPI002AA829EC|nr:UpxY family transcription antiterminator [uncultured Draconibacterium sp.]